MQSRSEYMHDQRDRRHVGVLDHRKRISYSLRCVRRDRGGAVSKVLRYKSEGRWFDSSWCQWIFHRHKILPIALWHWSRFSLWQKWVPGVFPGGKGGRCVRLTTYHHPVPLSRNLGTLISWNPLGPSGHSTGLLLPLRCVRTARNANRSRLLNEAACI